MLWGGCVMWHGVLLETKCANVLCVKALCLGRQNLK